MAAQAKRTDRETESGALAQVDLDELRGHRLRNWRQTRETRLRDVEDAAGESVRLKLVTVYPVSAEVPNFYHAFMGDAEAKTDSKWDSPSGEVYTWRWLLGRRGVAFYGNVVRRRPTFVAWDLLPAVLRLLGDGRMPDELYDSGAISADAYRIAQALDAAGDVVSTGDLRAATGFPAGKERHAAFQKALDELDRRLLLARTFVEGDGSLRFGLLAERHREHAVAADRLTRAEALDTLLRAYLPHAVYTQPAVLARHLTLTEDELRAGFARLVAAGMAEAIALPGRNATGYLYRGQ